jgi:hypothetical protein
MLLLVLFIAVYYTCSTIEAKKSQFPVATTSASFSKIMKANGIIFRMHFVLKKAIKNP